MITVRPDKIVVENIDIGPRLRTVTQEAIDVMSTSLATMGLRTPITVREVWDDESDDGRYVLVAGATRLAAAKHLGWDFIDAFVTECTAEEAEMWEIAENLHRAELTVQERSEQIARWVELSKVTQLASPSNVQPNETGKRSAAKTLGVSQRDVQRAVKVASITPEAKAAAREAGIDDNQSKLLEVAKAEPERQAAVVHELAQCRTSPPSNHPKDEYELATAWRRSFERVWNQAPRQEDREWARQWIDAPIMDARFGG